MPTYEYRCEKCGDVFEVRQKFADAPLTTHDTCGGPVERLLSVPALQFKGSGFYITDYAKGGNASSGNSPAKSEGSDKSDKKDLSPAASSGSGEKSTPAAAPVKSTPSESK